MEKKRNIDDIWTLQKVGTPFPKHVAKAPGETNKYVAMWHQLGKPVIGRAWNESGVVQCVFVADHKVITGADIGDSIHVLTLEQHADRKRFHYDWVKYKKALSLTTEGKYEMVRCESTAPAYWPQDGLLGSVDTDKLVAQFVDASMQIKTTKKMEELLVLCKISGSREEALEKERAASADHRMSTSVNDWEDFNWGGAWPANKNVMSTPRNAVSTPVQYVALWYRHGKPVMGRAWSHNGKIEASFVDVKREFTGATVGSLQLLISLPSTTVGYDYVWMAYEQAMDYRDKDFVPVHLGYVCPAIVPVGGTFLLGQVNMKTECATVALDGKVTQIEGGPVKSISVLCRKEMTETMLI